MRKEQTNNLRYKIYQKKDEIKEYNLKTAPLKSFYSTQNKLHEVNGYGSIEDIKEKINSLIDKL